MSITRLHRVISRVLAAVFSGTVSAELKSGADAPPFELLDQRGKPHRLSDYRGQWLVLYFYPRNDTPGCTAEACGFRDEILILKRVGVALLGVSTDDVESHRAFAEKYHLPFALLSDARGELARRYGSLLRIGPLKFAKRHTFIIDPEGRIAKIYRKVRSKERSDQVIADLERLGATQSPRHSSN